LRPQVPRKLVPLVRSWESYRYIGIHGGRGGGKSHFFAERLVLKAATTPGYRFVCLREIQKTLDQSVKHLIESKITKFGLQKLFDIKDTEIRGPGKGLMIFQGMQNHTADSIKSLEDYDGGWFEEAQRASRRSLRLLRPTIRKPGSQLWFGWNPERSDDPIDELLRGEHPPPRSAIVEMNWMDNPYFPSDLVEEKDYALQHNPEEYAHIWLGQYLRLSKARVFTKWHVESFETPTDARFYYGADWGYANDPSVLLRCFIDQKNRRLYVDYEAVQVGCEIENTPKLFEQIPGARRWPIRADSSRPETISFMRNKGFYIMPALKGPGSVEEGIEWLKNFVIIVHPRCVNTANELTLYSWKVDKQTEEVLPVLVDKNNHLIDALRYACESLIRGARSIADVL
jgi:phage terminase large subunit